MLSQEMLPSASWLEFLVRRSLFPRDCISRSIDGVKAEYYIDTDEIAWSVMKKGHNLGGEFHLMENFLSEISNETIIWDIGCSWGMWTIPLGLKASDGEVHAFDPKKSRIKKLKKNIQKNDLQNVYVHNLEVGKNNTSGRSLLGEIPSPDVAKIDVEGGEMKLLEGFGDYLQNIDLIILETHPNKCSISKIKTHLSNEGFQVEEVYASKDRTNPHIIAESSDESTTL